MMVGLQGQVKQLPLAKLALLMRKNIIKANVSSSDIYRPAAINQYKQ